MFRGNQATPVHIAIALLYCRQAPLLSANGARYFVALKVPNHIRRTVYLGDALMKSSIVKRSIVIHGHKTSVSLEDAFWNGLKDIAHAECVTLSKIIAEIDKNRRLGNLSSALRLFVLDWTRAH